MENKQLIEAIAETLARFQYGDEYHKSDIKLFMPEAQAAIAAIAEAGYAVVPVEMTKEMDAVWLEGDFGEPQDAWDALLAAALAGRP